MEEGRYRKIETIVGTARPIDTSYEGDWCEFTYQDRHGKVYVTTMPVDYFIKEYISAEHLSFGDALELIREGNRRMYRSGWNDATKFVTLRPGYPDGVPANAETARQWGIHEGDPFRCEPYFQVSTKEGSHTSWIPTTEDLLAVDWNVT